MKYIIKIINLVDQGIRSTIIKHTRNVLYANNNIRIINNINISINNNVRTTATITTTFQYFYQSFHFQTDRTREGMNPLSFNRKLETDFARYRFNKNENQLVNEKS
jgi:hypothetical protein